MEHCENFSKKLKASHGKGTEKSTSSLKTCEDENSLDFLNLSLGDFHLAQKVFGIHLTVTKILNFLPTKNLMSLRLVNKLWNEEITKLISNNPDIKIRLYFNSSLNCFQVGSTDTKNGSGKTLAQLNEHLENAGQLFCHNFIIEDHQLENPELIKFLSLYGKGIKILHLEWIPTKYADREQSLKVLRKLLVDQCPNVESLEINEVFIKFNMLKLFPAEHPVVVLPNLKSFSFSAFVPQIGEIIRVSPNLTKLNDNVFFPTVLGLASEKIVNIGLMKTLRLAGDRTAFRDFLKFARLEPQLTTLDLSDPAACQIPRPQIRRTAESFEQHHQQFYWAMTKLLSSSKNSLTHIDIGFHSTSFGTQVQWPRMEKVKSLTAVPVLGSCTDLPPSFISDCFPNVEKMELDFVRKQNGFWFPDSFLNSNPGLLKLKELQVKINVYEESLQKLNFFAPNVEILSVTNILDFSLHSKWIFGFKKLGQLNLELRIHSDFQLSFTETISSLLANFTGKDEESCLKILNLEGKSNQRKRIKSAKIIHKENPSLFDCKDLQRLNIEFACDCPENSKSSQVLRLMAHLLIEVGLKRMTNLIINYSFKYFKKEKQEKLVENQNCFTRCHQENDVAKGSQNLYEGSAPPENDVITEVTSKILQARPRSRKF